MTFYEIDPVVIRGRAVRSPPTSATCPTPRGVPASCSATRGSRSRPSRTRPFDLLDHRCVLERFGPGPPPHGRGVADEIRTLKPDGVIAFHVSSRYYDLSPAIAAALAKLDVVTLRKAGAGRGSLVLPSIWIAASRSPERLDRLRALGWAASLVADRPFTDDYADLLTYLHLGP